MGVLRFAEKWGPEYTMILSATIIGYDETVIEDGEQWDATDIAICVILAIGVTHYGAQANHLNKLPVGSA